MTYHSFYDLRVAGIPPSDVMERDELMYFAERATILRTTEPSPTYLEAVRSIGTTFEIEFSTDPELRTWFLEQLPADLLVVRR